MNPDRLAVLDEYAPLLEAAGLADTSIDHFLYRRDLRRRRRHFTTAVATAAAVAAGVPLLLAALPLGSPPGERSLGAPPTAPSAPAGQAADIARQYLDAFAAFDADLALGYLADDAEVYWAADVNQLPLRLERDEAVGYEQVVTGCATQDSAARDGDDRTEVRCDIEIHDLGSAELGFGPYPAVRVVTVDAGKVVDDRREWADDGRLIDSEIWYPFRTWIDANHPDDDPVLYDSEQSWAYHFDAAANQVWRVRTREYIAENLAKRDTATAFMAGWAAGDPEAAAEQLAAGGSWRGIDVDQFPDLAIWFGAISADIETPECALVARNVLAVECSYAYEDDITRAVGAGPVARTVSLTFQAGKIARGNDPLDDQGREAWQAFADWVLQNHPDDVERMYNETHSTPLLDDTSIDLWRRYVAEFVASRS